MIYNVTYSIGYKFLNVDRYKRGFMKKLLLGLIVSLGISTIAACTPYWNVPLSTTGVTTASLSGTFQVYDSTKSVTPSFQIVGGTITKVSQIKTTNLLIGTSYLPGALTNEIQGTPGYLPSGSGFHSEVSGGSVTIRGGVDFSGVNGDVNLIGKNLNLTTINRVSGSNDNSNTNINLIGINSKDGIAGNINLWSGTCSSTYGGGDLPQYYGQTTIGSAGSTTTPTITITSRNDKIGRVGIGVVVPQYKLDVYGFVHSTAGYIFPDGTTQITAAIASDPTTLLHSTNTWDANQNFNNLTDNSNIISINTNSRILYNSYGTPILTYSGSNVNGYKDLKIKSLYSYKSNNYSGIDFYDDFLCDMSGYHSIDWDARYLSDVTGTPVLSWGNGLSGNGSGLTGIPTNTQITNIGISTASLQSQLNTFKVSPSTGINSGLLADAVKVSTANLNATGTPSATTYLRGDGTWNTPAGGVTVSSVIVTQSMKFYIGDVYISSTTFPYFDNLYDTTRGTITVTGVRYYASTLASANSCIFDVAYSSATSGTRSFASLWTAGTEPVISSSTYLGSKITPTAITVIPPNCTIAPRILTIPSSGTVPNVMIEVIYTGNSNE